MAHYTYNDHRQEMIHYLVSFSEWDLDDLVTMEYEEIEQLYITYKELDDISKDTSSHP